MRSKIVGREELGMIARDLHAAEIYIVLTNGCFDLLHPGHIRLLKQAKSLGDELVVAVNSDSSVRTLGKGSGRPFMPEQERAEILAALSCVDYVTIFDEPDPLEVVKIVQPKVLIKGGDWATKPIIGREEVESWGGRVVVIPLEPGYSTTALVEKIRKVHERS